jgi:hypothetical protein
MKRPSPPKPPDSPAADALQPRAVLLILGGVFFLAVGCSKSGLTVPKVDAEAAAKQALAEYDRNHDNYLDAEELERCPALKHCLKAADKDRDGRLSRQEIADHIATYYQTATARIVISCQVRLNGKPLPGARVTYVPEKFLGPDIKPASGVSDRTGRLDLQTEGSETPGMHCGLFRVQISKKDASGRELLPKRYNTATTLGREVAPFGRNDDDAPFDLTDD